METRENTCYIFNEQDVKDPKLICPLVPYVDHYLFQKDRRREKRKRKRKGKESKAKEDKKISSHCAYMRTFITLTIVKNTSLERGGSQGISRVSTSKITAELTLHGLLG